MPFLLLPHPSFLHRTDPEFGGEWHIFGMACGPAAAASRGEISSTVILLRVEFGLSRVLADFAQ